MHKHSEILLNLSQAPDTQIDASVTARLRVLAKQTTVRSDEMLAILDDCAYASLASDFAMAAMDVVWKMMLDDEGVTREQAHAARDPSLRKFAP